MRSGKSSNQFEGEPYRGRPAAPGSTPRRANNWFLSVRVLILVLSLTGAIIRYVTNTAPRPGGAVPQASYVQVPGQTSFLRPPSTRAVSAGLATIVKRFPNAQFGTFAVFPLWVEAIIVSPGGDTMDVTVDYGGTPRISPIEWPSATFAHRLIDPPTIQTLFIALKRQFGIKPTAVGDIGLSSLTKSTPRWVASVRYHGQPAFFSAKLDGSGLERGGQSAP